MASRVSQSSDDIHDNLVKVIGQYGGKNVVLGTGFFVSKEYCLTCHHVICNLEKLEVEYRSNRYHAEWLEEVSDLEGDVAVLRILECDAKPMILAGDSFPGMKVKGCGFSYELLENLPNGKWFEGELSNLSDTRFNGEEIKGNKRWNKKPTIQIKCHQLDSRYLLGEGMSGSPVCYYDDYRIVGMLMAINKGGKYEGYVIPIKVILKCVQIEQSLSAPNQARSSEILLAEGNRYYLQNEFEMALQQYDKIINDPNYVSALNNRGKALEKLGRNQEAIYCYQMATTINSQASLSWYNKGWILHKEGKFKEALECFNEALNTDPNNANLWFYKAVTLSYMELYDESIESCNKALEIDPNNAKAWNNKSYALYKQGKFEEALHCSEKAVDLSPYDNSIFAWSFNNKGLILLEIGRPSEAVHCFDKSTELLPRWFWPWYNKGKVYHRLGKLKESVDCYSKAYELRNPYPSAYNPLKDSIISVVSEILEKDIIDNLDLKRKKMLIKLVNDFDKTLATRVLNKL